MANEKRLIDANALMDDVEMDGALYACLGAVEDVRFLVDSQPTVDAVEVVRCKDCKYWNKDAMACDTLTWVDSAEYANWYADDFCSYGERKDNG